jgi:hypothetical protein
VLVALHAERTILPSCLAGAALLTVGAATGMLLRGSACAVVVTGMFSVGQGWRR